MLFRRAFLLIFFFWGSWGAQAQQRCTEALRVEIEIKRAFPKDSKPPELHEKFAEAVLELDAVDSANKIQLNRAVAKVIATAQDLFKANGVEFRMSPDNPEILIISIKSLSNSNLNRLAFGLSRNLDGLELRFDPRSLKEMNVGALFDEEANTLLIGTDEIQILRANDELGHEIRHAFNFNVVRKGRENIFMAWLKSSDKVPPFHETYRHEFSLDEMTTYSLQTLINVHALIRLQKAKSTEPLDLENLKTGALAMLEAGIALSKNASEHILDLNEVSVDLNKNPEKYERFSESREMEALKTPVIGFRNIKSGSSVIFYAKPLVGRLPKQLVTWMEIEKGEFKVRYLTLEPLEEKKITNLVSILAKKNFEMAQRSSLIFKIFNETKDLIEADKFDQALKKAQKLRRLITP